MSEDKEPVVVEGVPKEWLDTPEGRRKAQACFIRNAIKMGMPPDDIVLQGTLVYELEIDHPPNGK